MITFVLDLALRALCINIFYNSCGVAPIIFLQKAFQMITIVLDLALRTLQTYLFYDSYDVAPIIFFQKAFQTLSNQLLLSSEKIKYLFRWFKTIIMVLQFKI